MSELTLLIMRIGFLLLLWLFVFSILYALRSDLFGSPARRMKEAGGPQTGSPQVAAPQPVQAATPTAPTMASPRVTSPGSGAPAPGAATQLVITTGVAAGSTIPLDDDFITIGRSRDSTLVIVDEYTSTYHARLSREGSDWVLTDLDSTNGTKLNGERILRPTRVPLNTPVSIGTTTFELRP